MRYRSVQTRGSREYRNRLGTAVLKYLVSDLVLFITKSESRFWIWFCLVSNLSLGLGFGIGLELISVPDLVPVHICHFVHTGLCLKLMPHWWFTYKMLGAEFEY